mmetsp:Transcript_9004/g.33574  ORF Transcript_9004/g.33574 Transcript_9004/m.33574 type:complete len:318 (-) Transcript_9004:1570-2523(-)
MPRGHGDSLALASFAALALLRARGARFQLRLGGGEVHHAIVARAATRGELALAKRRPALALRATRVCFVGNERQAQTVRGSVVEWRVRRAGAAALRRADRRGHRVPAARGVRGGSEKRGGERIRAFFRTRYLFWGRRPTTCAVSQPLRGDQRFQDLFELGVPGCLNVVLSVSVGFSFRLRLVFPTDTALAVTTLLATAFFVISNTKTHRQRNYTHNACSSQRSLRDARERALASVVVVVRFHICLGRVHVFGNPFARAIVRRRANLAPRAFPPGGRHQGGCGPCSSATGKVVFFSSTDGCCCVPSRRTGRRRFSRSV